MVRRLALVLLFSFSAFAAAAGDIAVFENLGFSADSRVFLFGQYGVSSESGEAFAEMFAVDVRRNSFVTGGRLSTHDDVTSPRPLSLGQDGRGALYELIGEAAPLVTDYGIDHLNNGRVIYILIDGDEAKPRISFRDFNTSTRYEFELRQNVRDSDDSVSAAFGLELTVTRQDDSTESLQIGAPNFYRDGVEQYRITQVLLSPDEDGVVVVVEKRHSNGDVRYMVETAGL